MLDWSKLENNTNVCKSIIFEVYNFFGESKSYYPFLYYRNFCFIHRDRINEFRFNCKFNCTIVKLDDIFWRRRDIREYTNDENIINSLYSLFEHLKYKVKHIDKRKDEMCFILNQYNMYNLNNINAKTLVLMVTLQVNKISFNNCNIDKLIIITDELINYNIFDFMTINAFNKNVDNIFYNKLILSNVTSGTIIYQIDTIKYYNVTNNRNHYTNKYALNTKFYLGLYLDLSDLVFTDVVNYNTIIILPLYKLNSVKIYGIFEIYTNDKLITDEFECISNDYTTFININLLVCNFSLKFDIENLTMDVETIDITNIIDNVYSFDISIKNNDGRYVRLQYNNKIIENSKELYELIEKTNNNRSYFSLNKILIKQLLIIGIIDNNPTNNYTFFLLTKTEINDSQNTYVLNDNYDSDTIDTNVNIYRDGYYGKGYKTIIVDKQFKSINLLGKSTINNIIINKNTQYLNLQDMKLNSLVLNESIDKIIITKTKIKRLEINNPNLNSVYLDNCNINEIVMGEDVIEINCCNFNSNCNITNSNIKLNANIIKKIELHYMKIPNNNILSNNEIYNIIEKGSLDSLYLSNIVLDDDYKIVNLYNAKKIILFYTFIKNVLVDMNSIKGKNNILLPYKIK